MEEKIKYEKISADIKKEIEKYFNEVKEKDKSVKIEEAMMQWFDEKFDSWLNNKYEKKSSKANARKYFRLDIEMPVSIVETIIESSKEETKEFDFVGTVLNISRGGLYYKSDKYLAPSSIIKIKVDFSSIDSKLGTVEALAMVVRAEKIGKNEFGIGITFSSIYDKNKKNVDLFIFKHIAYHLIHFKNKD